MTNYTKRPQAGLKKKSEGLVVGLTGGFGSGKSTVTGMFAELGATVVDSDRIVHELLATPGVCSQKIVRRFGKDILKETGEIDKARLAVLVFSDCRARRALEKIIHPKVCAYLRSTIKEFRRGPGGVLVLEIPLLFEVGLERFVDCVLVVRARKMDQVKRALAGRFSSRQEILSRIRAQLPLVQKMRRADIVIDNCGTLTETRKAVQAVWQRFHHF